MFNKLCSYGGYDGYHVFNDVAVLDTRTWKWTVKNTNAAVQGRADVSYFRFIFCLLIFPSIQVNNIYIENIKLNL